MKEDAKTGRPLRVMHVVPQLDLGGMEQLVVELARHADRAHHRLHFVCLGPRGPLADDIESCGWPVTSLGQGTGLHLGSVLRLAGLFRRWRADVVHTHNNAPLLYATPAARLAGVAGVVHTRHGRSSRAGPRQTAAVRLVSYLADRVVCVSHDARELSARQGIARRKLATLWNGIDLTRFAYRGPEGGGPVVTVARQSPEKDTETLLRAAALVAREHRAFRLEVAGDGPCLPGLRRLADQTGLAGCVRFLGQVRDVPAVLARASLFVLPSLTEGISLTLLEAMARGLPVVATRVGGNPEVVAEGQTGLLVPPRSADALADRMLFLLRRPEVGRQMGLAGRRRVEKHFEIQTMVRRYEGLYRRVSGAGAA
jgi:glycosyltransferase involved in cell wall biosynthesis